MFNIIARTTRKCWSLGQSAVVLQQRLSSFTVRDIYNEKSDEMGTLLIRFAKHIAMEQHKCSAAPVQMSIKYSTYFPVTDLRYFQKELRRTPADQLAALIIYASTYRSNADPNKFAAVLNDIDAAAVEQLQNMDDDTIFRTLYALLFLMPNWIMRTDFYRAGIQRLAESDLNGSKEKFVQLCFYLGLNKKNKRVAGGNKTANTQQLLQKVLDTHLDAYLPMLSTMDMSVISNAAYKAAIVVKSQAYVERLKEEFSELTLDIDHNTLLVNFIKSMRLQRIQSKEICERLGRLCESPVAVRHLDARGCVHLLAYFAENLWDRKEHTGLLIRQFLQYLEKSRLDDDSLIRGKDIGIFLWSSAQLNCIANSQLTQADCQRIETILLHKVRNNEFRYFSDQLVDCCLSLWTLGYRSRDLLEESVQLKAQLRLNAHQQHQQHQPKVDSRLTVLLSAAAIEEPKWVTKSMNAGQAFDAGKEVPEYLMKNRSDLIGYAQQLQTQTDIKDVKIIAPINGINIPGLLVQFGGEINESQPVFVELLTAKQILEFTKEPISLLRLKIRLLNALGHKVIVLHSHELADNQRNLKDLVFGSSLNVDSPNVKKEDNEIKEQVRDAKEEEDEQDIEESKKKTIQNI